MTTLPPLPPLPEAPEPPWGIIAAVCALSAMFAGAAHRRAPLMGAIHRQSAAGRARRNPLDERMSLRSRRWLARTASDGVQHEELKGYHRPTRRERKEAHARLLRMLATGLPEAEIYSEEGRGPRLSVRQEQIVNVSAYRARAKARRRNAVARAKGSK